LEERGISLVVIIY